MATLNECGAEILDQTPVSVPLGLHRMRDKPLHQRIREMILKAKQEEHEGYESFEDADDFCVEDDPSSMDMSTPYEEHFDHITGEGYFPESQKIKEQADQLAKFEEFLKQNAGGGSGVSSPEPAPAEQPQAAPAAPAAS